MSKLKVLVCCLLLFLVLFSWPGAAVRGATADQPDEWLEVQVKQVLDDMVNAYRQRNIRAFMNHVSKDFRGEFSLLTLGVRRDFRSFDDVDLRYIVVNTAGGDGKAEFTVVYQRRVISARDGHSYKDSGLTQLLFVNENGQAKLLSMKYPLLFGVSDAGRLAAGGIAASSENAEALVVDRQGNVAVVPFQQAVRSLDR